MKTHKFARKPFYVDAVRVSEDNIEEVSGWCQGEIQTDADGKHIKVRVHRPLTDRQTKAYIGDWVLYAGTGFKVYTPKAFDKSFEKVKTLTKAQADEAGIKVPHERSQRPKKAPVPKPPANPVLSVEDAKLYSVNFVAEEPQPLDEKSQAMSAQAEAVFDQDDEAEKLIQEVLGQPLNSDQS
jgi:hypothetical protein